MMTMATVRAEKVCEHTHQVCEQTRCASTPGVRAARTVCNTSVVHQLSVTIHLHWLLTTFCTNYKRDLKSTKKKKRNPRLSRHRWRAHPVSVTFSANLYAQSIRWWLTQPVTAARLTKCFPSMAVAATSTHCTYPWRNG